MEGNSIEDQDDQNPPDEEDALVNRRKRNDRVLLSIAVVVVFLSIVLALFDVASDQDPLARLNLILLCLLLTSWLVGLCREIKVRAWATFLLFVGLAVWGIAVVAGRGGDLRALSDVFCFKAECGPKVSTGDRDTGSHSRER